MADHKAIISGAKTDEESIQQSEEILKEINEEVNNQLEERIRIYEHKILPALKENHVIFYQSCNHVEGFHKEFISNFFREEIFPYLQPVPVEKENIITFLRDNRLYLAVRLYKKDDSRQQPYYFVIKLPYSKVPRFIELPKHEDNYYLMFMKI